MTEPPVPGPLTLNIEALRSEAERAARRKFRDGPRLRAGDVRVTAENQVLVRLRAGDGRARWAILLAPEPDIARIGILRFKFTALTESEKS